LNTSIFIAKRYFFSRKKSGFINFISFISMLSITFATAALVIVLSALNGMEYLLRKMFSSMDADLVITPVQGKSFELTQEMMLKIQNFEDVKSTCKVIEDNALLKYRDKQMIVRMKGVEKSFIQHSDLQDYIIYGNYKLEDSIYYGAILGRGVQYRLSVTMDDQFSLLQLIYPKNTKKININPEKAFNVINLVPECVFAVEKQYDDNYLIVPLKVAQYLMDYQQKISYLEIYLHNAKNLKYVQRKLKGFLGENFKVLNSDEQHAAFLKAVKIEKLIVYFIFTVIIAVASISIYLSLSMLVLEKRRDIKTLFMLGAEPGTIKLIFFYVGTFVALSGAFLGLVLGLILCWVQQTFELVSMGMQTSVVDAYPIKIHAFDLIVSFLTISCISVTASLFPSKKTVEFIQ
jgi:lipoprotein-releasing system permease protein